MADTSNDAAVNAQLSRDMRALFGAWAKPRKGVPFLGTILRMASGTIGMLPTLGLRWHFVQFGGPWLNEVSEFLPSLAH